MRTYLYIEHPLIFPPFIVCFVYLYTNWNIGFILFLNKLRMILSLKHADIFKHKILYFFLLREAKMFIFNSI